MHECGITKENMLHFATIRLTLNVKCYKLHVDDQFSSIADQPIAGKRLNNSMQACGDGEGDLLHFKARIKREEEVD